MNMNASPQPLVANSIFPITVPIAGVPGQHSGGSYSVALNSGLTAFIGPNGSGKTQALRALRPHLQAELARRSLPPTVRYLSAGRAAPFESFRSASFSPGSFDTQPAAVGHRSLMGRRAEFESLTGDIMALEERMDLRIKVEARLYALFHKRIRLQWTQSGIEVSFRAGAEEYPANTEASGILQLIGLVAALYDDRVGALLIDEPEVSLHPQLQAFLMAEMSRVAGNALESASKKLIVIATHSESMLRLRDISDLPNLVFFSFPGRPPKQLSPNAGELRSRRLGALVARLGESHRAALFSDTVFLVEGPSDEIIVAMLSSRLARELAGAGTQIVPVIGKGSIPETAGLFRLMGKRVVTLADLDAFVDDNSVVMTFANEDEPKRAAETDAGARNVASIDASLRTDFAQAVADHWSEIAGLAESGRYLAGQKDAPAELARRRAAMSVVLSSDESTLAAISNGSRWTGLKARATALLGILEVGGCFFLRRGTIEDYYQSSAKSGNAKPEAAVNEAETFATADEQQLLRAYDDVWRAVNFAAPPPAVDENSLLRELLASLLAAVFQRLRIETSDADLAVIAATANGPAAKIFDLKNASDAKGGMRAVSVAIASPLFVRGSFPTTIRYDENLHAEVERVFQ
jgi:hypothetical protein